MSKWFSLPLTKTQVCLKTTLFGGQSFRWVETCPSVFSSVIGTCLISLKQDDTFLYYQIHTTESREKIESLIQDYFQLSVDIEALYADWSSDANFKSKAGSFKGASFLIRFCVRLHGMAWHGSMQR